MKLKSLKDCEPVIIIGMHRSGTSMVSRLLKAMGVHMGNDLSINAESLFFQYINRDILKDANADWFNIKPIIECTNSTEFVKQQVNKIENTIFEYHGRFAYFSRFQFLKLALGIKPKIWGWKDPRNSLTLPIWLKLFPSAKVIHVIRNGIDSAISLHKRSLKVKNSSKDYCDSSRIFRLCFELWEMYLNECFNNKKLVPDNQYIEVRYEDILSDPDYEFSCLFDFLNISINRKKLLEVTSTINKGRLNNEEFRLVYKEEISKLPDSKMMNKLSYN